MVMCDLKGHLEDISSWLWGLGARWLHSRRENEVPCAFRVFTVHALPFRRYF